MFVVAASDIVFSETGPCLASSLSSGGAALAVDANGSLRYSRVRSISAAERSAVRLLTAVGDVVVVDGMCVMTRRGPKSGAAVARGLSRGATVAVEVVRLRSVPAWKARTVSRRDGLMAACRSLPGASIVWPTRLCDGSNVETKVLSLLRSGGTTFTRHCNKRWHCIAVDERHLTKGDPRGAYQDQLELLRYATAWAKLDDTSYILRIRDVDRPTRQALFVAALGAGSEPIVTWSPGYYPIEARVRLATSETAPFAAVTCTRVETHQTLEVELDSARQVVAGALMMMPQHGGGN